MTVEKPDYLRNDDHATFRKNGLTLVLDTSEKYTITENLPVATTGTTLVYAETIEIIGNVKCPGKSLGLFCTKLIVPECVEIAVSGETGAAGAHSLNEDGGGAGPGADSGNVWIFVQDLALEDIKNLDIQANGGEGGRGGNASSSEKTGGRGGNGGNAGVIEITFGSRAKEAMDTFCHIDKTPWPDKVSSLLGLDREDSLSRYLTKGQRTTLESYQGLGLAIRNLVDVIRGVLAAKQAAESEDIARKVLHQMDADLRQVKLMPPLSEDIKSELNRLCSQIENHLDIPNALQKLSKLVGELSPGRKTQLSLLLDEVYGVLDSGIREIDSEISRKVKENRAGPSGPGGRSGPGIDPGPRGNSGKEAESTARWLKFDTAKEGLDAHQAYIFPEQCQMLLNKTDRQFFSADWKEERGPLIKQYDRIVQRLNAAGAFDDSSNEASRLWTALAKLENHYQVTTNIHGQLRSIADQARSRRNRLALGQDMFGHSLTWVPRLSYDFYAQSLNRPLDVLHQMEELEAKYRQADQKSVDMRAFLDAGIQKMTETEREATTKISFLTGANGEITNIGTRIVCLTQELPEKRKILKDRVSRVSFEHRLDPQVLIDGFSTLASLKPDLQTVIGLWKLGTEIGKQLRQDTIKDENGKEFKDEFVIGQIAQCTDSLESLDAAIKTREDNTLSLDDPRAIKLMAKMQDITKLMDNFQNCIPPSQRKDVDKALSDYKDAILKRNDTVVEYNASIQLLIDARRDQKNAREEAARMKEKRLDLDPTIPAISLWLRGTKDKLSLQLMERLHYASRAVAYWGLTNSFSFEKPGPLRSSAELRYNWSELDRHFESILHRYAGNVRSIWPPTAKEKGLFYDLTSEQLASLKTASYDARRVGKVYKVTIALQPNCMPFGGGRADVRLNEVRLWLVGATVNADSQRRCRLTAHVRHMGDEVFEDESGSQFPFSHDSMTIPFEFDTAKVKDKSHLTYQAKLNQANALQDQWTGNQSRNETNKNTIAAVGPFASWCLEVRECENGGLDMHGVTSAHLEFCGANRSFTYSVGCDISST